MPRDQRGLKRAAISSLFWVSVGLLAADYWLLLVTTGYWLLTTDYWLATDDLLVTSHQSLVTSHYSLLTTDN